MHLTAYAVTHILADDAVAVALNVILNSSADIGYPVALLRELDALEEALSCNLDEFSGLVADLAAGIGACAVTNKALEGRAHVDGHDVAVMDDPLAGDAVYDLLVHRDAGAGRESAVAQKRGLCARLEDELMHILVYLPGSHTGLDRLTRDAARTRGDLAGLTHQFNL